MREFFRRFAQASAAASGSVWAWTLAVLFVVVWAAGGPVCHYSDTWQLVVNTATSIVIFLMVFLIQNSQIRDAKALHLKTDELLRAVGDARTGMVRLEDLSDEDFNRLENEFKRLHDAERHTLNAPS